MSEKVGSSDTEMKQPTSALILLEEDDEFEEFESGHWDAVKEEPDEQIWKVGIILYSNVNNYVYVTYV